MNFKFLLKVLHLNLYYLNYNLISYNFVNSIYNPLLSLNTIALLFLKELNEVFSLI